MKRGDIHDRHGFFEYVRVSGAAPPAQRSMIDVAILDMNHSWPNLGHDSLVHALLEAAEPLRKRLVAAGLKLRVLSFDVRRGQLIPDSPDGRFGLYVGTGGPGHLDPRQNDGERECSQGIRETAGWEAPLFRLFDDILAHPSAALVAVCHSFGLLCRWSGAAHVELRAEKSSGMPTNVLSTAGTDHPWFAKFANALPDGRHFRVIDNRLFDLVLDGGDITPIAFERDDSGVVTMAEFARAGDMPRIFGANHHPEIVDRQHLLQILDEKRRHGEVSEQWYRERSHTLENEMLGEAEQQSRLTSEYTLMGPLRFHVLRLVNERTRD
jgi:hypothetical protein